MRRRVKCRFCGWTYPPGPIRSTRLVRDVDRKLEEHLTKVHRMDGKVADGFLRAKAALRKIAAMKGSCLRGFAERGDALLVMATIGSSEDEMRAYRYGSGRAFDLAASVAQSALDSL